MAKAPKAPTTPVKKKMNRKKKPARKVIVSPLGKPPLSMPRKRIPTAPLSPSQVKNLHLISEKKTGYTPAEFAEAAYKGSPGWDKECRTGTGPHGEDVYLVKGGAMNITAGANLAKLKNAGHLYVVEAGREKRYFITPEGREAYAKSVKAYREHASARAKSAK